MADCTITDFFVVIVMMGAEGTTTDTIDMTGALPMMITG